MYLEWLDMAGDVARLVLDPDMPPARIGRTPQCAIFSKENSVSRLHGQIGWDVDGYYVSDLGSSNGTFLNGARLARGRLQAGDVARCGEVLEIRVIAGDPPLADVGPAREPTALHVELTDLRTQADDLRTQADDLRGQVAQKDRELTALHRQLEALHAELQGTLAAHAVALARVQHQNDDLARLAQKVTLLQGVVDDKDAVHAQLRVELRRRDLEIAQLRAAP